MLKPVRYWKHTFAKLGLTHRRRSRKQADLSWRSLGAERLEHRWLLTSLMLDNQSIALSGLQTYDDVQLINGATIVVSGSLQLNTDSLFIDATSSISADGRGYLQNSGPGKGGTSGGGGHGGRGGGGNGGAVYGDADPLAPITRGSGGGSQGSASGGTGGGAIAIDVDGAFVLDGEVSADGTNGGYKNYYSSSHFGGGGAGGSISVDAGSLSGSGKITVNGGEGGRSSRGPGGGGAGGRVAVSYTSLDFTGDVQAIGGYGNLNGEDGVVVYKHGANDPVSAGVADEGNPMNPSVTSRITGTHYLPNGFNYAFNHLVVEPTGRMIVKSNYTGTLPADTVTVQAGGQIQVERYGEMAIDGSDVVVAGTIQASRLGIDALTLAVPLGGIITADALGYTQNGGLGKGGISGGGGHGGRGGRSTGGGIYGDPQNPTDLGSGGGSHSSASGGAGGGAISIDVSGTLQVDGEVSADGANGGVKNYYSSSFFGGGGSGGSISVSAGTLSGSGKITVNGGRGGLSTHGYAGGGAGGRLAVTYTTLDFNGDVQVAGGYGDTYGEDGTLAYNGNVSGLGNTGNPMTTYTVTGFHYLVDDQDYTFENLVVASGGELRVKGGYTNSLTVETLTVQPGGKIVVDRYGELTFNGGDVNVAGKVHVSHGIFDVETLTVPVGGIIKTDSLGYAERSGPGAGGANSGGGHGGKGGGSNGGGTYGNMHFPTTLGSGGGRNSKTNSIAGGSGGGVISITASDAVHIDGEISADGGNGTYKNYYSSSYFSGGGAGGSIGVVAHTLSGAGVLTANGGAGGRSSHGTGGGGGGGRICAHYEVIAFTGTAVANGGYTGGEAGTICWLGPNVVPTDIILDSPNVAENEPVGTTVGSFSTTDPDLDDIHTYSLVVGDGSEDNASFTIDGNTLRTAEEFDFEIKDSYGIRVRTDDGRDGFFEKALTITVINVEEPAVLNDDTATTDKDTPVVVNVLANDIIDGGLGSGATVVEITQGAQGGLVTNNGTDVTYDPAGQFDYLAAGETATDTFTYALSEPHPGTQTLITNVTAHAWPRERTNNQQPRLAVDGNLGTYTWSTLSSTSGTNYLGLNLGTSADVNRIRLWKDNNGGGGANYKNLVIRYTTDSPTTPLSSRTFQNVSGLVNGFEGTELLVAAAVNSNGTVINDVHDSVNEGHGWASLTFDTVQATGVVIQFSASSWNHYKVHEFQALFTSPAVAADTATVTITVEGINNAPVANPNGPYVIVTGNDLSLDGSGSSDPDDGDSIVLYEWDLDNDGAFDDASGATPLVDGDDLLGLTTDTDLPIHLRVTDSFGGEGTASTTLMIIGNQPPTDISLTDINSEVVVVPEVPENAPVGTVVCTFSTIDPDTGDDHTYSLVAGDGDGDNASFTIDGDELKTAAVFDHETKDSYSVRVQADDSKGGLYEETLVITVTNVNEAPVVSVPSAQSTLEDRPLEIAGISVSDVDSASLTVTLSVSGGDLTLASTTGLTVTGNGTSSLEATGSQEDLNTALSSVRFVPYQDINGQFALGTSVSDGEYSVSAAAVPITVTPVNDAPIADANGPYTIEEGDFLTLDGLDSSDVDGNSLSFSWELNGDNSFDDAAGETPTLDWADLVALGIADDGSFTVALRVDDGHLAQSEASTTLLVENADPIITGFSILFDGTEGQLSVVADDPGATDELTFDWVVMHGNDIVATSSDPGFNFDPPDNGTYDVTLTVSDGDGGSAVATTQIDIVNVEPTFEPPSFPAELFEGSPGGFSATAIDPGQDDLTFTWDWGDGTTDTVTDYYYDELDPEPDPGLVQVTDTVSHTYGDNGVYGVTLTVTDDDGGSATNSTTIVVANVDPTINSYDVAATGSEGTAVSLDATASDPGGINDPLTFTWTVTRPDSSTLTLSGASANFTPAEDGVYGVSLTVTDDDGGSATNSSTVDIANVAPTVDAGLDQTVNEGQTISLAPSTFNDLGTADTHTATVNWGDGSAVDAGLVSEAPFGPPGSTAGTDGTVAGGHVYADNGSYTVTVTVTDDEGASTADTLLVTVANVAPGVVAGADQTVKEGDQVNFSGLFNDAGSADTHTATLDWGDGTTVDIDPATSPVVDSHVYADNGVYTVTLTVTDDDNASTGDELTVTVLNVAPGVVAGADQTVNEGDLVELDGSFSDPGSNDTHTFLWEVSADNGQVVADGTGEDFSFTPYDNGIYTLTYTVTDDDNGFGADTVVITVNNVSPTAMADTYNADVFTLLQVDTTTSGPGVLANDTDPAGAADPLTVTTTGTIITTQGAMVTMNFNGSFEYNATTSGTLLSLAEGQTMVDTFTYAISDGDDGTATATVTVTVTGGSENSVHVVQSPCGDGSNILIVRGSQTGDKIDVKLGSMAKTFKIKIKTGSMGGSIRSHHGSQHGSQRGSIGSHRGSIGPKGSFHMGTFKFDQSADGISKVIVYGLDGNDDIKVDSNVGVMGWLFGGNGDDKLRGGKGDDLLVGGADNDKLDGKAGRDILIGGLGADKLKAHKDEDILISGSTIYDSNLMALCGITNEWTSANSFQDRVDNIFNGSGVSSGVNGEFFFDNATVAVSDGEKDELDGGSGSDWFVADEESDRDKIKGHHDEEDIFGLDANWFNLDL